MTLKQYQKVKLISVFLLAIFFSQALQYDNYLIPIAAMIVSALIMLYLRRSVKEVVADERDYALGGKAALLSMQIYSWIAVIAMFVFYGFRDLNPSYESIGMTLAFSTTILLLIYSVIFRYFERISFTDKKLVYSFLVLLMFVIFFIAAVRGLSGEDSWICEQGQWVQHGHPDFPAPEVECK